MQVRCARFNPQSNLRSCCCYGFRNLWACLFLSFYGFLCQLQQHLKINWLCSSLSNAQLSYCCCYRIAALSLHSLLALFSLTLKASLLLLLSAEALIALILHVFSSHTAIAFAECSCTRSSGMFQNQFKLSLHSLLGALLCSHTHSKGTHCLRSYCCCCYEQFALSVFTVLPFSCSCCCCFLTGITFASLWEWVFLVCVNFCTAQFVILAIKTLFYAI